MKRSQIMLKAALLAAIIGTASLFVSCQGLIDGIQGASVRNRRYHVEIRRRCRRVNFTADERKSDIYDYRAWCFRGKFRKL